jgi:hypothetical protein
MRDARSWPSAISFRMVDRAHWSFALTCATDNILETGMFLLGLIFIASTTVKTSTVFYVVERNTILVVDGRIGQRRVDRLKSRK